MLVGIVEGFYNRVWSTQQRQQLFSDLPRFGLAAYLYAPKDDLKHRRNWRDLYDAAELALLKQLIDGAQQQGVEFIWAVSPGLDMRYADATDLERLKLKLRQVQELGCNSFAVLFDDIEKGMRPEDIAAHGTLSTAHCTVTNAVYEELKPQRLMFCPTEYCTSRAEPSLADSEYLATIGRILHPAIQVFWTGDSVIPVDITPESLAPLCRIIGRKPVIWDNIHANDYDARRVFLGPYAGRPWQIGDYIDGVLTNPNCEFGANYVALHTLGSWARLGAAYEPAKAYTDALSDWLPRFALAGQQVVITLEELRLFGDLFYLPYDYGERALDLLTSFLWLEGHDPEHVDWQRHLAVFNQACSTVRRFFTKVSSMANRELFAELYPYLFDLKENTAILQSVVRAFGTEQRSQRRVASRLFRPSVSYGGIVTLLQSVLAAYGESHSSAYCTEAHRIYTIRSHTESDRKSLYDVCSKMQYNFDADTPVDDKFNPGDRWVGPYLKSAHAHSFVLQDNHGVCGYAMTALDTKAFFLDMVKEYLPAHVTESGLESDDASSTVSSSSEASSTAPSKWTPTDFCIASGIWPPEVVYAQWPAHLHIHTLPRARGQGNEVRLLNNLLQYLRERHVRGVHVEIGAHDEGARDFYERLGFRRLLVPSETEPHSHFYGLSLNSIDMHGYE